MKRMIAAMVLAAALGMTAWACAETSGELAVQREFGKKKEVTRVIFVNGEGVPTMADDKGYAILVYKYDASGQVTACQYQDAQGNPVNNADGYAFLEQSWKYGKVIDCAYYDAEHRMVMGPEGYARKRSTYLNRSRVEEIVHYDAEGKPLDSDTLYARYHAEYDKVGKQRRVLSEAYYDENDQLMAGPEGYAQVQYSYATGTKLASIRYLDAEGKPFFNQAVGYASMEYTYSPKFRLLGESYYDAQGKPVVSAAGYASVTYDYTNGSDEPVRIMYYDADGQAMLQSGGYYGIGQLPSENRYITIEVYYGADGERGNCEGGYSRVDTRINSSKKVLWKKYYDANDQMIVVPSLGYAWIAYEYDNSKQLLKTQYLDTQGQPVLCADGYAELRYTYDKQQT